MGMAGSSLDSVRQQQLHCLQQVLELFNQQNIRYCVLRNYEFLLDTSYPVESLDIVIAEQDFPQAVEIISQQKFISRKPQFSLRHKAFFKLIGTAKVSFDIQVGGVYWNDMRYMDESILHHRVRSGYFYVPSANDTAVQLLCHSILGKRYFKVKYQRILSSIDYDLNYVLENLSRTFGQKYGQRIISFLRVQDFDRIPIYRPLLHFLLHPRRLRIFLPLCWRWVRWKKPLVAYPLISVIGPDGAGKSTVLESLAQHLRAEHRNVSVQYGGRGRGHVLPISKLGRAYKKAEKQRDASIPSLEKRPAGGNFRTFIYSGAALVFAFDFALRYMARIFLARRRHAIVITDRYCSDLFLMKHVPTWLKSALISVFPKPTLTFYLYQDAEVLHERRPEESIAELERQLALFTALRQHLPYIALKTTNPEKDAERVIQEVEKLLLVNWY